MPKQKNQFDFPQAELEVDEKVKPMKISKRVMAIGKRNGLKPNEIVSVQAYVTNGFKKSPAYGLTHPAQKPASRNANCHQMFRKPAVIETIEAVLADNRISKGSVLKRHNEMIDEARDAGQFGVAISGNKDLWKLVGLEAEKQNNTNIFISNTGDLRLDKIDSILLSDVIEGEIEE